ncbi:YebC/PmpR family DNA-binding transcriptional regulator [Blattabacterium punctulatus]|uniref:YebC/PmpR family DNA-binding transcriptional regulator n=1 Tax=Blattabacterium punctulatus TaxID=164514 RepID=UPI000D7CC453|nr:YebC/PmpR family DNA-binding transcriptional regulator [Blattabacterium punctulatus]AWU42808.1 YebC/PmpR family DNA-binding transcriptional regulator [Blattabacterium punctulatus]AWU43355.1 YebC/PmpR family DNA-binding transcriptional regulator [Blattabacterium punctulatus]AWU45009.1 YebC/PmpR family DNA-binding transcriptional regulator [Blattabacterium punctulatus]AWU46092.1 YebC/PmpR family DNA-binding transcriptional regulator [Blattabacterium punctulatus]
MSGHSKWTNIQHRKSHQDFIKSKKFSKIIKEIYMAVRESGSNNNSFRLKKAIINAKSLNIPKITIEKTIQKALKNNKNNYKNLNLEGQIQGISLIIECMTDNSIKTTSNIKFFFHKNGGRLFHNGTLTHLFNRIGIFSIKKKDIPFSMDDFELISIDFGAKEIRKDEKKMYIYTDFKYFGLMKNNYEKLKIFHKSIIQQIAKHPKYISKENGKKISNFIEKLKENENIKNIYSNMVIK